MCERALQQKNAKVNIISDFLLDKTYLTPLYPGHKPIPVMIDSRSSKDFAKIKANLDTHTF